MSKTASGTARGRILAALALTFLPAMASAKERPAKTGVVQTDLNFAGSAALLVAPIEVEGEPWLELRTSLGANMPTTENNFYSHAVVLEHDYFRLTVHEAAELAAQLRAWLAQPHSMEVFSVSGGSIGLSLVGNAWDAQKPPVIVFSILLWIQQERGHIHGGNYVVLTEAQAAGLADAVEAWMEKPGPGPILYQQTVY